MASDDCQRYGENKSIFDQLPPAFSLEDLAALKRDNTPRNSLIKIISRWKRDGWIGKTGHNRWNKVAQASATKMTMTK